MKTVYIAGKITGDPNYKEKFLKADVKLLIAGYIPLNPTILPQTGFSYEAYIRMSRAMLSECEYIYLLPDWEDSPGARGERNVARFMGIKVLEI